MSTKKIAFIAMLTAIALTIFIIESQIPPIVPIPGIKLGLANVITLFTLVTLGRKEAFIILILRIVLGNIFVGSVMSCIYSLAGGIVCFVFMAIGMYFFKENMIWFISVIGAIGHNIGQIVAAVIITNTVQIVWYLPILIIAAIITGVFTGFTTQSVLKHCNGFICKMIGAIK